MSTSMSMQRNKARLYVVLFGTPAEDGTHISNLHWGFVIGPKVESSHPNKKIKGTCFHVMKHPIKGWIIDECTLPDIRSAPGMLARTLVAKIEEMPVLLRILRETHIPANHDLPNERWIDVTLRNIAMPRTMMAVGTAELRWSVAGKMTYDFAAGKCMQFRYKTQTGEEDDGEPKPVFDMLENREIVR